MNNRGDPEALWACCSIVFIISAIVGLVGLLKYLIYG